MKRTNWTVLDFITLGETLESDPVNTTRDKRVFCLARSSYALKNFNLLAGWYQPEGSGWRWTEKRFSIAWRAEGGDAWPQALLAGLCVSAELLADAGGVVLSAEANRIGLTPEVFRTEGEHMSERAIPAEAASCGWTFHWIAPPWGPRHRTGASAA